MKVLSFFGWVHVQVGWLENEKKILMVFIEPNAGETKCQRDQLLAFYPFKTNAYLIFWNDVDKPLCRS